MTTVIFLYVQFVSKGKLQYPLSNEKNYAIANVIIFESKDN